jgi:large subunit ribosomal protein L35
MPKMKSNRAAMKRFKVTGTGKVKEKKLTEAIFLPRSQTKEKDS